MLPQFSSAWLELAMAGLVTAISVNRRLSSSQQPLLCATALAAARGADGRRAILRATCEASESSWARVVRAALREPATDVLDAQEQAGYREAPRRSSSASVMRVVAAERARITRSRTIAMGGSAAAVVGAAMLLPAQGVVMSVLIAVAMASGWRAMLNARRATAALDEAGRALPELVATLPPPPPPVVLANGPAPSRVRISTSTGFLGGVFVLGLGLMSAILVAGLIAETTHLVPASQIALLLGVHVMLAPLLLVLGFLLPKVRGALDVESGEVVFDHRVLGIRYAQTIAPLELVESFFVESRRRFPDRLAVETEHRKHPRRDRPTPEQRILLVDGEHVAEAAATLNRALGRTGWKEES